jgi:hypothetical protein
MTFETDNGSMIYWRLSWGGAAYTGSNTATTTNDADGNFGPPFPGPLPSTGLQALRFQFAAGALSTNNAADYVITPGAAIFTNNAGASFTVSMPAIGACCNFFEGTCEDDMVEFDCAGDAKAWAEGLLCAELAPPCPSRGACCAMGTGECLFETEVVCSIMGGDFIGEGVPCAPGACDQGVIGIIGSDPPNNAIDSRQPSSLATGCMDTPGFDVVTLMFDGSAEALAVDDFFIGTDPMGDAPSIMDIIADGPLAELQLDQRIPVGRWTTIRHIASGTSVRIGFLPGDVDNNRSANPQDILRIIDHLNGVQNYADYQTDVDRSSQTNPADILRVIDLLNGAGCFAPGFNGATLAP